MQRRSIDPLPGLAFAQAVETTGAQRLLFISGQVPAHADGSVPPDYPSQYRLAWANVEARLVAAGMTFDNLVKVTIFLSDLTRLIRLGSVGLPRLWSAARRDTTTISEGACAPHHNALDHGA